MIFDIKADHVDKAGIILEDKAAIKASSPVINPGESFDWYKIINKNNKLICPIKRSIIPGTVFRILKLAVEEYFCWYELVNWST